MNVVNDIYNHFGTTNFIQNDFIEINDWTLIHFINGMLLSYLFGHVIKNNYLIVFILHTLFELVEGQLYFIYKKKILGENFPNKVGDTIAFMLGYYVHYQFISDNRL